MSLEKKLKQAALCVALRHMMKDKEHAKERTCRNVIALGTELTTKAIDGEVLAALYEQLLEQINRMDQEAVKKWVIEQFGL